MFPENYSISNFKCFKERTSISLRPITINIGPNNSGKSSFIKSLELLKHSLQIHERKESKYILKKDRRAFIPELHSFNLKGMGSPGEFLNSLSNELEIFINPEISEELESYQKYDIKLGLAYVFKENRTRFESDPDSTSFFGGDVMPELPSRGVLNTYTIYIDNKLLVRIEQDEDEEDLSDPENGGEYHGGHSAKITINANLLNILFSSPNTSKLDNGNIVISTTFAWDNFYFISKLLKKVKEVIFGKKDIICKEELFNFIDSVFWRSFDFNNFIRKSSIINLSRRNSDRYIHYGSDSKYKESLDSYFFDNDNGSSKAGRIRGMLKDILPLFDLPAKFHIEASADYGFIFKLETGENRYRNIADFGSGINQLLPLFIIGGASNKNDLLIVEEPESNLHPNYQSKLADVFALLQKKRKMNFIIETHSEYMVRRFQYLVAKGKIKPEDIIINYFWIDNEVHKCKQIEFKSNGGLSKPFEPGFYEESLQQQLELLKINSLN